jgi:hypothetical protein
MKNAITNYENTFYLEGVAISGISSVDGSYSLDYKPINILGKGFVKQVIASVPTASLSINRYLINNDPIFSLTGDGPNYLAKSTSGGLYYNNTYFSFSGAYLKSLSVSCSVGEVPQIASQFDIYGNIGPVTNPSGNNAANSIFVPQVKDITVTCRDSSTNRVKDFNVDFNCAKNPIYGLTGSNAEYPIEVHNVFPIEVVGSFTLDIDDYETKKVFDDLTSNGDTSFVVRVGKTNEVVFAFTGTKSKIVSEEVSSSADDVLSVKVSYKTYID